MAPPPPNPGARVWPENRGGIIRAAVFSASGLPAAVMFFSMAGYGSMCREFGLPFSAVMVSTPLIWGLPGQIAMAEMAVIGAPVAAVALAVAAANARFMPMVMALLPHLREDDVPAQPSGPGRPRRFLWRHYLLAQMMSLNSWTAAMRDCPAMPRRLRQPYFFTFSAVCLAAGIAGTAAGYLATGVLPRPAALGLVFLNPAFFALIFADVRTRSGALALAFGAPLGPLAHLAAPDWGLPLAGLAAGSAAFAVDEIIRKREAGKTHKAVGGGGG